MKNQSKVRYRTFELSDEQAVLASRAAGDRQAGFHTTHPELDSAVEGVADEDMGCK